ncbi:MAG TPA: hypothetical protein VM223_21540 [Planctomycetota bacterium]|nr:hypothetical protein [Planctomycetota bacterium]
MLNSIAIGLAVVTCAAGCFALAGEEPPPLKLVPRVGPGDVLEAVRGAD